MKAVVKTILAQDPEIELAVLPYVDDLLVDKTWSVQSGSLRTLLPLG